MRIKLNKSQWEQIGRTAGWIESAKKKKKQCWKGYEMVGTKEKDGKTVPNCVPKKAQNSSGCQRCEVGIIYSEGGCNAMFGFDHANDPNFEYYEFCPHCGKKNPQPPKPYDPDEDTHLASSKRKINTAGGWGKFSEDLSDALEAQVSLGVRNGMDKNQIFEKINSDATLMQWINQEGGDNTDIMDCIIENMQMHEVVSGNSERIILIKALENYASDPNVMGFLSRIRESKYYRKPPLGRPSDEPSTKEIKRILQVKQAEAN